MEKSLRITTVQSTLHWEHAAENLSMFSKKLEGLAGKTDLVVLPEMFNTPFNKKWMLEFKEPIGDDFKTNPQS